MEKNNSFIREITLSDLWRIFLHRLWIMILAMVLVMGAYITYDKLTYVPEYSSTATLYILKQSSETNQNQYYSQDYEDFTLALKVVNDCNQLLKSHSVLDTVIEDLGLEMSYNTLRNSISTSNPEETRILTVTVRAATPELAKRIVDCVCDVGVAKITEAMGFKQVNLYEYGILNTSPSNTTSPMSYIILGVAAMAAVYIIFFLTYLFDDRLKTDEEIERALELTVIGDIPNADEHKNHKYGYYKYGKRYGYRRYSRYGYGKYGRYGYGRYGAYGYGQGPGEPIEEISIDGTQTIRKPVKEKKSKKKDKKGDNK
ncbi:MAG: hypothetical protein IJB57_07445 [Clostridia bacterium]|nr:hypothetical protein [Clostridia bacterium]